MFCHRTFLNSVIIYIATIPMRWKIQFGDYLHSNYSNELEGEHTEDTTDTQMSAPYLDLHLDIDNGGRLKTNIYYKRDDFIFLIVNFSFVSSKKGLKIPKG